ncbi:MAG: hypothetical protein EZS28_045173, partial [Streblomastix strix]
MESATEHSRINVKEQFKNTTNQWEQEKLRITQSVQQRPPLFKDIKTDVDRWGEVLKQKGDKVTKEEWERYLAELQKVTEERNQKAKEDYIIKTAKEQLQQEQKDKRDKEAERLKKQAKYMQELSQLIQQKIEREQGSKDDTNIQNDDKEKEQLILQRQKEIYDKQKQLEQEQKEAEQRIK